MTDPRTSILRYLAAVHKVNADTEVSGPELQRELGLDAATVEECVGRLADQGLVDWDRFLTNIWLRITDKGLMTLAREQAFPV